MMRAGPSRPRMTARLARALGLDGNPLRRATDRLEAWIRVGLLAVFLTVGPMAAAAAGGWATQMRTAESSARAAQVHAVRAVLLQPAPGAGGRAAAGRGSEVWVRARWDGAGAAARTGEVLAPGGSPTGTVVTVWLDASGRVADPPPEPGQSGNDAVLAVLITLVVVVFALLAALRLIQRFLNWRRLAAWEVAWSVIGPRWTGHRS